MPIEEAITNKLSVQFCSKNEVGLKVDIYIHVYIHFNVNLDIVGELG